MANDESLEGIVIFPGSLNELNNHLDQEYEIAGTCWLSHEYWFNPFKNIKIDLKEAGFDGLIRADFEQSIYLLGLIRGTSCSGVPIKRK